MPRHRHPTYRLRRYMPVRTVSNKVQPEEHITSIENDLQRFDSTFVHESYTCNGCGLCPITGYRYHAIDRPDFDLCYDCITINVFDNIGCTISQEPSTLLPLI